MSAASPALAPSSGFTAWVLRHARAIRAASVVAIAVAVVLLARVLPAGEALGRLSAWVEGLGAVAPVVFGLIYVLATVLLIPGSVLTLAAGAVFGLGLGLVVVSLASTAGAALCFLIARHVARARVARWLEHYPKVRAIDRAVGERGWKIVALLRLSPALPFNVQNYLYGLTAIGFWPCVLASWLAMLPGTLLYVYLGHAARQGLEVAAGAAAAPSTGRLVLTAVGLLATAAVTIYAAVIAYRAIREQADLAAAQGRPPRGELAAAAPAQGVPGGQPEQEVIMAGRGPAAEGAAGGSASVGGTLLTAALAVLLLGGAILACAHAERVRASLAQLFGPPAVQLAEAYERKPGGAVFDHGRYDALLRAHVREGGWVDYQGLMAERAELEAYLAELAQAPFEALGRDEKLALLLNAYNAFTLALILEHWPVRSILDIPAEQRWKAVRWQLAGVRYSLDQLEHEQIRPRFAEPRIHFALVCAAIGCPPLRAEAYTGARLEQQLEEQARYVHAHERWFRLAPDGRSVELTKLYEWYGGDFVQVAGSVLAYAARYVPRLEQLLEAGQEPAVRWLEYDWRLNDLGNRPAGAGP